MSSYFVKVFTDDFNEKEWEDLKPEEIHFIKFKGKRYEELRYRNWVHYEHREPQYDIEGYKTWAEAYKCSNCGFIHTVIEDFGHYSFCPRCGADMRGDEE